MVFKIYLDSDVAEPVLPNFKLKMKVTEKDRMLQLFR